MKRLYLLRHAKSDWGDPELDDVERRLNERGQAAARAIGVEVRRLGLTFDLVVASPARRVAETLAGARIEVDVIEPAIYAAHRGTLAALVRALPDNAASALIAGHHPGLPELALWLSEGDDGAARVNLRDKYPTGALTEIELAIERWDQAGAGCGRVTRFIRPRDL